MISYVSKSSKHVQKDMDESVMKYRLEFMFTAFKEKKKEKVLSQIEAL